MLKLGALHLTKHTGTKHTATVIYCHGSGSNGDDMKQWATIMLKNFSFPHINILYPTAPLQPYTPAGHQMSNVWFDRAGVDIHVPEKLDSIGNIENIVKDLIKKENDAGIPNERIIFGGFSMGGALALHAAYRWHRNLAGVFVFSSFLNDNSIVYENIKKGGGDRLPPLLQLHGDVDDLVPTEWGEITHKTLTDLGVQGEFHILRRLGHSIDKSGMKIIKEWIEKHLPET